jgi:hypothetical protein
MITLKESGLSFSLPPASQERSKDMLQPHIRTIFDICLSSLTSMFIFEGTKVLLHT